MSQHEDSLHLEFEVVNAVMVNISDAARSTQTRQRIGLAAAKEYKRSASEDFKSDYSEIATVIIDCNSA
jgi:hypothetical protein